MGYPAQALNPATADWEARVRAAGLAAEVTIPLADEGIADLDEEEAATLGEIAEGPARSWWPPGFAQWIVPLLVGAAVGVGLLWAATAEGDGESWSW